MQLSATTTAAKPLPVDLLPEAFSPYLPSVFFQSPSRRRRRLPGGDVFASPGCGAPSLFRRSRRCRIQGLQLSAALDDPRWFGRVAFTYVSFLLLC